ncbi:MAG: carbohydrate kinase [Chitinophagaceae bacterium]|nr:MAG: carbohydrate kinase [Chitinophagaceae bacterium]
MEQTSQHQVVCFGEVLWDLLPTKALPGGAPMNVAYHLKKLGANPVLLSKIGTDDYGKGLVDMLAAAGLTTDFLQVDYTHPTGLVYAKPNEYNEVVYDIVFPSAWDFIEWQDDFSTVLSKAPFFVYGSLTSRNNVSRNTLYRLLEEAKTKVLDINLRPPHFNRAHVEYLLAHADILKMNIAELELITGWFSQFSSTEERVQLIQDHFQIDTVIVTMGGDGALVNDKGKLYRHGGFKVTVADTIGSGDSFLAGFLSQLLRGASTEKALDFASGIGAFMATQQGACPDYQLSQITDLIQSTPSSKLQTISNN